MRDNQVHRADVLAADDAARLTDFARAFKAAARAVAKAFSALMDDVRKSGPKACLAFLESDSEILSDEAYGNPYRPANVVQLANAYADVALSRNPGGRVFFV